MSGLVRVTINDRTIEVPAGTLVTDAARAAEVHVPIFCSHSKLPPLGACRICVVEVGTPRLGPDRKPVIGPDGRPEIAWNPKVQTGCTTPVSEGMVVRTQSPVALDARKGVMEFLLINHPLDCPVCDEGGECQLQDLAFAFGDDFSRMDEAKRTFESEDLGPIVKKEANRCIVCMRCVRYCDEVMGEDALTAHQRGVRTEISSFNRQPLDCEQCGNCIEVCPVGALTAVPYRFKARPWDLRQHISVCPYCSNGCSVRLGVRGMEILRARGTEYRGVNQEYLCVRGRFGYGFVNAADRLSAPLVRAGESLQPSSWDDAVAFVAMRLGDLARAHGPESIAFLGGERLNVEEQYLFQKLARGVLGTNHVDARTRFTSKVPGDAILRATGGGRPALTFDELCSAQEALVLFEDLQGESPFAQAVLIRGQHQRGLHLTVAHPRRVKLARPKFQGEWLGVKPGAELALVNALTKAALDLGDPEKPASAGTWGLDALKASLSALTGDSVERETGVPAAAVAAAAKRLRSAGRRAIVFGRGVAEHPQAAALLQAIENLAWATGAITDARSSVMYAGPQHDSQGALDMGLVPDFLPGYVPLGDAAGREAFEKGWGRALDRPAGRSALEILEAAAAGSVKALWIASDHLLQSAPDRALVEKALATAELVIVNELFLTGTAQAADVVFPVASFAEKDGVVVNSERRLQKSSRALSPRRGTRADWEVFQAVAQALGAPWKYRTTEDVFREIARLVPGYQGASWAALLPNGWTWSASRRPASLAPAGAPAAAAGAGHWLLAGGTLFTQGSLTARSAPLANLAGQARAYLNGAEASKLGLSAGDPLTLEGPAGSLTLPYEPDDSVPPGAVFVPYAYAAAGLNRLGAPQGAGLRVNLHKAATAAAAPAGAVGRS
ncbi:MAG: NADH-quinone oxidoreductase subunit NuoG [Candidatus Eisenbacteria bacterium]|nr:NADH-quinone oxidoreductase subunit NuoG [Candidatus Eisenbacteria bacterium]